MFLYIQFCNLSNKVIYSLLHSIVLHRKIDSSDRELHYREGQYREKSPLRKDVDDEGKRKVSHEIRG